ncbi:hypothetical protein WICPIJ_001883 [Wickerhamomyces pijperi]|uniref:Uncharacterized protein n=1 Tax=Wickerhamomyces pijperi TaxID=599730 RepID=A0A9P8QA44_WICPI|nr:hypothetical protein WICPIJ_001883 [Wickerhamomyces pijperi]
MGFLNPGSSSKRKLKSRSSRSSKRDPSQKKRKLDQSSTIEDQTIESPYLTPDVSETTSVEPVSVPENTELEDITVVAAPVPGNEQEEVITDEFTTDHSLSPLERLPTELIHEIFVLSMNKELPFVSKSLLHHLRASVSLKFEMMKMYLYDLNEDVLAKDQGYGFEDQKNWERVRYALDYRALKYKFITADVLSKTRIDVIAKQKEIEEEKMERLRTYVDKLNKRMIEVLMEREVTAEELNKELARMAEERFNLPDPEPVPALEPEPQPVAPVALPPLPFELEEPPAAARAEQEIEPVPAAAPVAPQQQQQQQQQQEPELEIAKSKDLPISYYTGAFTQQRLSQLHQLTTNTNLKYHNLSLLLSRAITQNTNLPTLQKLLTFSKDKTLRNSDPIISAFEKDDIDIVCWLLTISEDIEAMRNDDALWMYIGKKKNSTYLKFMEDIGGSPTPEVLSAMSWS